MTGWNVLGFVISALVSALVAILVTGKINSGLNDRAHARELRQRAMRALLIGPSRQPLSWSLGKLVRLSEKQLGEIFARLATLAEEASSVSISAAQAFLHAAQMFPILSYDADQWNQLEHDATEKYQREGLSEQ
jgi:hypothetical protein